MISKRMKQLASSSSLIRAMFEEGKKLSEKYGKDNVFDFSLGNPYTKTPDSVKTAIKDILDSLTENEIHGYMSNSGYTDVRQKVANWLNNQFEMNYTEKNIVMTVGAAGGLNCVLQTLLNVDDEVIVVSPFFTEYKNYIENWQGKMVVAKADSPSFDIPVSKIRSLISNRTKAIIVNNPNNPTGVVYSSDNIKELSQILIEAEERIGNPIYLLSDEPYREIVYDGIDVPFIPKYYHNSIVVYSWSKSLSLPGERIGYVAISPNADDVSLLFSSITISNRVIGFVNAPSLMQLVVERCLDISPDVSLYAKNRLYLCSELKRIGYEFIYPQGAFYLWIKAPCDEMEFVERAKKHNLLLVPGSAFYGDGYVRLAYCVDENVVKRSIMPFEKLWNEIDKNKR